MRQGKAQEEIIEHSYSLIKTAKIENMPHLTLHMLAKPYDWYGSDHPFITCS